MLKTRKSNPFHGFLNGLTQPVYSEKLYSFFTIFMLVDETFLILCPYFDSPFRYPLRYDLLPLELFNSEAPKHRSHTNTSRPLPFLRTLAQKANLHYSFLGETPL